MPGTFVWQRSGNGHALFFVFTISLLPNYRVKYYDYIEKWYSGVACNWCVPLDIKNCNMNNDVMLLSILHGHVRIKNTYWLYNKSIYCKQFIIIYILAVISHTNQILANHQVITIHNLMFSCYVLLDHTIFSANNFIAIKTYPEKLIVKLIKIVCTITKSLT